MLDQQDGRVPLLVEPSQQPYELVAGDRIELRCGLVQEHEPGTRRKRCGERHTLQLTAGELVCGAVEQLPQAERQCNLLDRARHRAGRVTAVLQAEGELGAYRAHHDLRLGVLKDGAGVGADSGGAVLACVEPGDGDAPGEVAAVKVRNEAAGGPQQRGLARR